MYMYVLFRGSTVCACLPILSHFRDKGREKQRKQKLKVFEETGVMPGKKKQFKVRVRVSRVSAADVSLWPCLLEIVDVLACAAHRWRIHEHVYFAGDMSFYSVRWQPRQQAWSKQKEQKEKKMRRREIKELKRKRKNNLDLSDLQDLEDDTRLLKKLKKGKVSNGTLCARVQNDLWCVYYRSWF